MPACRWSRIVAVERCGHADDHHVGVVETRGVAGGAEPAGDDLGHHVIRHVVDVATAGVEPVDGRGFHVETDDRYAGPHGLHHEGKPHVAEANHDEAVG
jgi:hypothetical protein